jgi:hypothetical protein
MFIRLPPYPWRATGLVWKFRGREKSLTPSTNPSQLLIIYPVAHFHYTDYTILAHSFAEEIGKNHVNFNRLAGDPLEIWKGIRKIKVRFLYTNISVMLVLDFLRYTSKLTSILPTWRIGWAPNNASKWQMGFNWVFKWLIVVSKGETGTYRSVCRKHLQGKHKYVDEFWHSYFRASQVYL